LVNNSNKRLLLLSKPVLLSNLFSHPYFTVTFTVMSAMQSWLVGISFKQLGEPEKV
jgi:hypothetical protein